MAKLGLSGAAKFLRRLIERRYREPQPSRSTIINDYGAFMERNPASPTRIEDVSVLPYPKKLILSALLAEIGRGHPQYFDEMLRIGAMSLAQYQPGIGEEPLEMLGLDVTKFPKANNLEALRAEAKRLVEAEGRTRNQFNDFNELVEEDLRRISSKIAALTRR